MNDSIHIPINLKLNDETELVDIKLKHKSLHMELRIVMILNNRDITDNQPYSIVRYFVFNEKYQLYTYPKANYYYNDDWIPVLLNLDIIKTINNHECYTLNSTLILKLL
jgi:hypothetical protein